MYPNHPAEADPPSDQYALCHRIRQIPTSTAFFSAHLPGDTRTERRNRKTVTQQSPSSSRPVAHARPEPNSNLFRAGLEPDLTYFRFLSPRELPSLTVSTHHDHRLSPNPPPARPPYPAREDVLQDEGALPPAAAPPPGDT
jgi:hypothetical protein